MWVGQTGHYHLVKIGIVLALSFLSQAANADTQKEELIRLSKLAFSAFECSVEATNENEEARLFDVGLVAGRKFLDGMNDLGRVERDNLVKEVAPMWFYKVNRSTDFVMGEVYQFVRRFVYDQIRVDGVDVENAKKEHLYFQGHCASIR